MVLIYFCRIVGGSRIMVIINPKGIIPDETWYFFREVRAIVSNEEGCILLGIGDGKCMFPGGRCDDDEDELPKMKSELEKFGIKLDDNDLKEVLTICAVYDDFFDCGSNSLKPCRRLTTCYYTKIEKSINTTNSITNNMDVEWVFMNDERMIEMLMMDHSSSLGGKFYDIENVSVVNHVLRKQFDKN